MMELSYRQYKILSVILQSKGYVTSKVLTDSLNITRRTLINDIKTINSNNKYIDSDNKGYFINKEFHQEIEDLLLFYQEEENNNTEILKLLLTSREKINMNHLQDQFYMSKSSLQKCIHYLDNILSEYILTIKKQNNFLIIEGDEFNKRCLMAKMIHRESESFFDDINNFSSYFPNIEVENVAHKVLEIVEKNNYYIPKYYEMNFIINVLVILSRNPFLKEIAIDKIRKNKEMYPEVKIAHEILYMMGSNHLIHYINPSQVIQELDMCLFGFIHPKGQIDQMPTVHYLSDGFINNIRDILKEVFDYYYLYSIDYESFLNVFSIHVSELIKRCAYSQNFTPTNVSVRQTSPYIYEVAVSIAKKIYENFKIQVPDSEINLIAIHIGYAIEQSIVDATIAPIIIVTENYRNIGTKIAEKITSTMLGKVQIMGFYHRFDDIPYRDYKESFIISTIQYSDKKAKVCYISPFFNDQDYQKVYIGVQEFLRKKTKQEFLDLFDMYISEDCFFSISQKMDKIEAIELLVNKALKNKDVNENFYNQVLEREKYSSTAFYGKFAIPHSNVQNANVTKLYIMVNQEGVKWDDENIKLIFLILIKREAANDFRKLYVGITETLYHSNVVFNNLDKIKTVEDLKKYLLF